jgi:hypothetical protein
MKHTAGALILTPLALALLAGCSAGAGSLATPYAAQQSASGLAWRVNAAGVQPLSLKGENFQGRARTFSCLSELIGFGTNFHASGIAKGPISGTFTAQGDWGEHQPLFNDHSWSFEETFTIVSGTSSFSGSVSGSSNGSGPWHSHMSCTNFGSDHRLSFTLDSDSGRAKATVRRRRFQQTFY